MIRSIEAMSRAVKLLSLGLDYRRYAKFRLLSPPGHLLAGYVTAGPQVDPASLGRPWPPSTDACRFCFDFVVEAALRLQEVVIEAV